MITKFKIYEELSDSEINALKDRIIEVIDQISAEDNSDDILEYCPFLSELNILHQKDYIEDIFYDLEWLDEGLEFQDFMDTYNQLIVESEKTIIDTLTKDPSLYTIYNKYIDGVGVNTPEWIKNASKYNI